MSVADRIAAQHSVVSEDWEWFVGVCRRVERETRAEYADYHDDNCGCDDPGNPSKCILDDWPLGDAFSQPEEAT